MSRLQELIQTLCPDGVEYKRLGDVCTFTDGFPINAKDIKNNGNYPVIKIGNIRNGHVVKLANYLLELPQKIKKTQILEGGEILVAMSGSTGKTGYNTLPNIIVNQRIAIIRNKKNISNSFLRYLLVNESFEKYCFKKGTGPQNNISKFDILAYSIPIPPLAVQEEIVRILDAFTSYAAELQAELQARKEQYAYYRDQLLTFDEHAEGVEWKKLGEIGTFTRGNGLQKKDFTETGFPCIHYGQIHTHYGTFADTTISYTSNALAQKLRKASYGDLIIATTSEDVEGVCKACTWLGKEDVAVSGDSYIYKHNQNPKYIAYLFQTRLFDEYKRKAAIGTKVVRVTGRSMENFIFPIPSLIRQQRIVSILDKFEALVNDLTEGLPAEIAAVQEQYEYYRNKLLSFPRK